jgi:hypothetical protein
VGCCSGRSAVCLICPGVDGAGFSLRYMFTKQGINIKYFIYLYEIYEILRYRYRKMIFLDSGLPASVTFCPSLYVGKLRGESA